MVLFFIQLSKKTGKNFIYKIEMEMLLGLKIKSKNTNRIILLELNYTIT